ncbi:YtxH domain-containing protein [Porphyromonas loveana]|uniref:Putative ribosomally synthesized peptide with SipW-like signal peptide n=1 Tax=Porphyromonas loveana TaxID=1884669 RepID=A0A2U1FSJ2_9PORP|nr:YtxH domain-containing protein [Porphyromonas loveana]PVZ15082.1 putative ribosomally synthesized peptide with SipW-like signal peptide [Porphyromonas loveana]
MNSQGKFSLGVLVGLAVGATVAYFADREKRTRFVEDFNSTADKVKDSVVEGYYEAKHRYQKYRRKLKGATEDLVEEMGEKYDEALDDLQ